VHFLRINNTKKGSGGLSFFIVAFLLILYLVGVVEISPIHSSIHSENDKELHSAPNEENACHQAVYHNRTEDSCKHKSHIVELKNCSLCHLTLQSQHLADVKPSDGWTISSPPSQGETQTTFVGDVLTLIPSRGPPTA